LPQCGKGKEGKIILNENNDALYVYCRKQPLLQWRFSFGRCDLGRISLDICTSNPQVIYALTAYANGNSRGLYKSIDGGANWLLINGSVAGSSNYAWFNRICKVSPTDANNIYCGGLNMERSVNGGTFSGVNALMRSAFRFFKTPIYLWE
jgi:hypothetical protein